MSSKIARRIARGLGACALSFVTFATHAADKSTPADATAMAKKAAAYIRTHGPEKSFAEFNNPYGRFVKGDLYVMCYDMQGNNKCHGGNAKLVGKSLLQIRDVNGVYIVKGLIGVAQTKGQGWVDYQWPNPLTRIVESKSTYVEKINDNLLIGVGAYK